jgi:exonuclease III
MKIITLNIWGARIREPFIEFIKRNQDADIFCFQEIYNNAESSMSSEVRQPSLNIYSELKELLPDFQSYFRPVIKDQYGIGMFIKSKHKVLEEGEITLYENKDFSGHGGGHTRNLQWVRCDLGGKVFAILNVHGIWNGKGKTDTPERIAQSQRIKELLDELQEPKIL